MAHAAQMRPVPLRAQIVTRSVSSQAGSSRIIQTTKIASAGIDEHNLAAVGDHHRREPPAAGGRPVSKLSQMMIFITPS